MLITDMVNLIGNNGLDDVVVIIWANIDKAFQTNCSFVIPQIT